MAAPLFYPGDPQDSEGLIQFKERVVQLHRPYRQHMERDAYRNVLFYLGHQWIVYDDPLGVWRPMGLKKGTPRPVTIKICPQGEYLCIQPRIVPRPYHLWPWVQ